MPAACKP